MSSRLSPKGQARTSSPPAKKQKRSKSNSSHTRSGSKSGAD